MRCPICGANIEITELPDGSTLVRYDCKCNLNGYKIIHEFYNPKIEIDVIKSSQLGFEVPEVEPEENNKVV